MKSLRNILIVGVAGLGIAATAAWAAGEAPKIDRQNWSFSGMTGQFDRNQLQRGFQVYKTACASCHTINRIAFRNLAEPGGPQFPEDAVKALAAEYQVTGEPDGEGKPTKVPGKLSDRFPPLYANEKEARSIHNGAYPPDLSLMARARGIETHAAWYIHPFLMLKDVAAGYQEGGADYIYALLSGYSDPPSDVKMAEGMNYNRAFPGHQIAMAPPLSDGVVEYKDGTPSTVSNYARDVAAFLSWTADPHHDRRKRLGWQVLLYLLIMSALLYMAKRRIWADVKH
jgi:cytochrome c1